MAKTITIYRTCPTCCPDAIVDFDFHGYENSQEIYSCRNCGHKRIKRTNKRGSHATPSQNRVLARQKAFWEGECGMTVESEMRDGIMVIRAFDAYSYHSWMVGRRGKVTKI